MEEFQGNFKAVNITALVLSRIVERTKVHRCYGVQRIKQIMNSVSVLAGIPFRPQIGELKMGKG